MVVNALHLLAYVGSVSPSGSAGFLWVPLFTTFPVLLLALLAVPVVLIWTVADRGRIGLRHLAVGLASYVVVGIAMIRIGGALRLAAFDDLAERSRPLVDALRSYEMKYGRPAPTLESLVPEYLGEVPKTGMGAYPTYEYEPGARARAQFGGNTWVVYVNTPSGGINFDIFVYYPNQRYPERGHGGRLRRIGDWAYVHE